MKKRSLTAAVAEKLRLQILGEKWQSDQPLPSEREISRMYRVSRVTARRCLQALRREGLVTVQPGRGYFPVLPVPRGRRARHLRTVIYLYATEDGEPALGPKDASIINGANAECLRLGLNLYAVSRAPNNVFDALGKNWRQNVRGVLLDWAKLHLAEELRRYQIPFVIVEDDLEKPWAAVVIQDNVEGTTQALQHMTDHGHRRIGIVVNNRDSIHPRQRLSAYREFLLRHELPFSSHWVQIVSEEAGAAAVAAMLEGGDPPTAVFLAGAGFLGGVMEELARRGLQCPRDLSIVVWGDPRLEAPAIENEHITYVTWDGMEMGRLAVRTLEQMICHSLSERAVIRVPTRLVDQGSVAVVSVHPGKERKGNL